MNRSELWNSVSSERMKWTVAGFKSHLTRNLKKARTSRQKAAVKISGKTRFSPTLT